MSLKTLETLIRELQKSVVTLTNKVCVIESKIDEKLTSKVTPKVVDLSKATPTTLNVQATPTADAAAAARPVRQARAKAYSAITAGNTRTQTVKKFSDAAKTPEVSRPTPTVPDTFIPSVSKVAAPKAATTPSLQSTPTTSKIENDDDYDNSWKKVIHKRKKNPRMSVMVGTGMLDAGLQTVEKIRHMQAWSFKPETTEEALMTYLKKIEKCEEYTVEKRNILTKKHACFVIGMPDSIYGKFQSPSVWPQHVRFTDWFPAPPRGDRRRGQDDNTRSSERSPLGAAAGRSRSSGPAARAAAAAVS